MLPNGKLRLPKIGDVPVRWSRPLPSEPSGVTVVNDAAGRFFASFVVQAEPRRLPAAEPVVGIDLGLTHFAVLSDGRKIARARVADARRDFHHQLSTALIRDNQAIAVEDLAVKGLGRTRLAKSVHDAGWASFVHMVEYKARLYGRGFHRIGRFEPTSQVCPVCGAADCSEAGTHPISPQESGVTGGNPRPSGQGGSHRGVP